jgi:hypothetical protein
MTLKATSAGPWVVDAIQKRYAKTVAFLITDPVLGRD